jgi:3-oxoadipate CoA-transferase, alpha subunit
MIDKRVASLRDALAGISDGSTVLVGGFGLTGAPSNLLTALLEAGPKDLTIVANNAGVGTSGLAALLAAGRVRKILCSYPRSSGSVVFEELYQAGKIELELVPQGTLSERIRAGGAGIGGFYTQVAVGTRLAEGREVREIDGVPYLFESPIKGDVALIRAENADRWGNLTYRLAARNFNPIMATAATLTVAEVASFVELGALGPDQIMTPAIFIDRVVETGGSHAAAA